MEGTVGTVVVVSGRAELPHAASNMTSGSASASEHGGDENRERRGRAHSRHDRVRTRASFARQKRSLDIYIIFNICHMLYMQYGV
jgi:hypothetical protein